jgi:hypothetical protein
MLLFLVFSYFSCYIDSTGTHPFAGDLMLIMWISVLMLITAGVCVSEININTDVDNIPIGLKPMPCTLVDLYGAVPECPPT